MLSRKYYKLIAGILHANYPMKTDIESFELRKNAYDDMLNMFIYNLKKDNPRFNEERFRKAIYS